jgi:hypothetical protein
MGQVAHAVPSVQLKLAIHPETSPDASASFVCQPELRIMLDRSEREHPDLDGSSTMTRVPAPSRVQSMELSTAIRCEPNPREYQMNNEHHVRRIVLGPGGLPAGPTLEARTKRYMVEVLVIA